MSKLSSIIFMFCLISGCSTTITDYKPRTSVPIEDALNTISRLTMTQHKAWRPDGIGLTDEFFYWGYGTATNGTAGGMAIGMFATANSRSTTRAVGDRLYFDNIKEVQLLDWLRKGKQWYVVSVLKQREQRVHVFRTRFKEDAISFSDALASVEKYYRDGSLEQYIKTQDAKL